MATIYVDSAAAGLNDGTSWTDAYTSIELAEGAAAGDVILIDDGHSETLSTNDIMDFNNGTIANPIIIKSVDKADDSYSRGATIQCRTGFTDWNWEGCFIAKGLNLNATNDIQFAFIQDDHQELLDCQIAWVESNSSHFQIGDNAQDYRWFRMEGGSIDFSGGSADGGMYANCAGDYYFSNVTVTKPSTASTLIDSSVTGGTPGSASRKYNMLFESCDLGDWSVIYESDQNFPNIVLRGCKIAASVTLIGGTREAGQSVTLEYCDDGTITVPPLGLTGFANLFGTASADLSNYRTGGADDGLQANPYSVKLETTASVKESCRTYRVPLGAIWIGADGSPSGATAQNLFTSARRGVNESPVALTTDSSSTWNGSGVGTKQKIDHTLNGGSTLSVYVASGITLNDDDFWIEVAEPDQVGGLVIVHACLAKPSTTVYVDPKIEVT